MEKQQMYDKITGKEQKVDENTPAVLLGGASPPNLYGFTSRKFQQDSAQASSATFNARSWYGISNYPNERSQEHALSYPDTWKRWDAVQTLDIPWRITFGVAEDIWVEYDTPPITIMKRGTESAAGETHEKNDEIMQFLYEVDFFNAFELATAYNLVDGHAEVLMMHEGFDFEDQDYLQTPWNPKKDKVVRLVPIPAIQYTIMEYDDATLKPKMIQVDVSNLSNKEVSASRGHIFGPSPTHASINIHGTRFVQFNLEPKDMSPYGFSTIASVWLYLMVLMNIVIGSGEAFHRWGTGKPKFTTNYETQPRIDRFAASLDNNPVRKDWFILPKDVDLEMVGNTSSMIPDGFEDICISGIIRRTKIPRSIMQGEVEGVQTGSRVSERAHFMKLAGLEKRLKKPIREFLKIVGWDLVKMKAFIKWATHYVEDEETKWATEKLRGDAAQGSGDVMTIDEVRKRYYELPPLPNGWGNYLLNVAQDVTKTQEQARKEALGESDNPEENRESTQGDLEKGSEEIIK